MGRVEYWGWGISGSGFWYEVIYFSLRGGVKQFNLIILNLMLDIRIGVGILIGIAISSGITTEDRKRRIEDGELRLDKRDLK